MSKRCCAESCFNSVAVNNKVAYFGFPRSLEYAEKWLIAAGRGDLLDKPLDKLVKYYMCADHFESSCFHDPDTKTRLKKNNRRPVVVPVPTIFKCNLINVIGQNVALSKPSIHHRPPTSPKRPRMTQVVAVEDTVENCSSTYKLLVPLAKKKKKEEVMFVFEEDVEITTQEEEVFCRLCNKNMDPNGPLIFIFEDDSLVEALDIVLPGDIQLGDGFSPVICPDCQEDLSTATQILTKFRSTQDLIKSRESQ